MATTSPKINPPAKIPFWRDIRILAIIAQSIFMAAVLAGFAWLISNFLANAERQGLSIGFDFLRITAGFDIAEGIDYSATDTFGRALWVGTINTIRVSLLGIILTTITGILVGIARLSNNWLLGLIAGGYIEIIRNVPLLVVLYFIYFGIVLQLPSVDDSVQPFGLPIFLNQRGISFPGLTATIGFPIWLAFIVLATIFVMILWTIQSRQEEQTGKSINKGSTAIVSFLIIVAIGWFVTGSFVSDQGMMVATSRNITEFKDYQSIFLVKIDTDALAELGMSKALLNQLDSISEYKGVKEQLYAEINALETDGGDPTVLQEQLKILDSASLTVCGEKDSIGVINASSRLRRLGINVKVKDEKSMTKASANYAKGNCDLLAGTQSQLAAERSVFDAPDAHTVVPVSVTPMVVNTPAPAGFNIQGGGRISPEFAALLFGLVLYTSTFAAEIVRAGILSVSKGQSEAARALGLNEGQRLRLIVLPQAMRVIIPPMTSQYLNLTKNSSLAVAIAYPDLVSVGNTVLNNSGQAVQVIIIFMTTYLSISLLISAFLNWYNKKVALVER
ncbi:ABC transporter permease subunit [Anaerolineales bacterium HSG24]|nr:ABC transporter permease subunit [Anaerolineales bacterium HSG24]